MSPRIIIHWTVRGLFLPDGPGVATFLLDHFALLPVTRKSNRYILLVTDHLCHHDAIHANTVAEPSTTAAADVFLNDYIP